MNQFTPKRMLWLGLAFLITIVWMIWMQVEITPFGDPPAPSNDEWSRFWPAAIASMVFVVVVDVIVIRLTLRRTRELKEKGEAR